MKYFILCLILFSSSSFSQELTPINSKGLKPVNVETKVAKPTSAKSSTPKTVTKPLLPTQSNTDLEDELYRVNNVYEALSKAVEQHRSLAGDYETAAILLDSTKPVIDRVKQSISHGKKHDLIKPSEGGAAMSAGSVPTVKKVIKPTRPLESILVSLVSWHDEPSKRVVSLKVGKALNKSYLIRDTFTQNKGERNQIIYSVSSIERVPSNITDNRWIYTVTLADTNSRRTKRLDYQ